jgi:hypothetical protein
VWLFVALWVIVGLGWGRKKSQLTVRSEAYLVGAAGASIVLWLLIGLNDLIGLVFLVWLRSSSAFWFVWELIFLTSVVAVFWVGPVLSVALLGWAILHPSRARFRPRTIAITVSAVVLLAIDALFYCAIAALSV